MWLVIVNRECVEEKETVSPLPLERVQMMRSDE